MDGGVNCMWVLTASDSDRVFEGGEKVIFVYGPARALITSCYP